MSTIPDDLALLVLFGRLRRQLNLKATQALKPMGIGPKQAILMRELETHKCARLNELAQVTHTDPTATGKAIETLIRKGWVRHSDLPGDRRCRHVGLTAEGSRAARKIEGLFRTLAREVFSVLPARERTMLHRSLSAMSSHLEVSSEAEKEKS